MFYCCDAKGSSMYEASPSGTTNIDIIMVVSLLNRVYAVYIQFLYNEKRKQKKIKMEEGKN